MVRWLSVRAGNNNRVIAICTICLVLLGVYVLQHKARLLGCHESCLPSGSCTDHTPFTCSACNERGGFATWTDERVCDRECPEGYFIDSHPGLRCTACIKGCSECKDATTCVRCLSYYLLQSGKCEALDTPAHAPPLKCLPCAVGAECRKGRCHCAFGYTGDGIASCVAPFPDESHAFMTRQAYEAEPLPTCEADMSLNRQSLKEVTDPAKEKGVRPVHSYVVKKFPSSSYPIRTPGHREEWWRHEDRASRWRGEPFTPLKCHYHRSIVVIPCGYIDYNSSHIDLPGQVYDGTRRFPVHPFIREIAGPHERVESYDKLANGLSVYANQFPHFTSEVLPHLLYLVRHIPEDVKILMDTTVSGGKWLDALNAAGWVDRSRIVSWKKDTVYFAKQLYFHMVEVVDEDGSTTLLKQEFENEHYGDCSWRLSIPHMIVRDVFNPNPVVRNEIVLIHRKEAYSRQITNHEQLRVALEKAFPDATVRVFVGSEQGIMDSARAFYRARLLIAAHGAGVAYMHFLPEGASLLEIGYDSRLVMAYPAHYYMTDCMAMNLHCFMSLGRGSYPYAIEADIDNVVTLARQALDVAVPPAA